MLEPSLHIINMFQGEWDKPPKEDEDTRAWVGANPEEMAGKVV